MDLDLLDAYDRALVERLLGGLAIVARPYAVLAAELGEDEETVLADVRRLVLDGVIVAPAAQLRLSSLFIHTTLALAVSDEEIDLALEALSRHPGVSHVTVRDHPVNLWCTFGLPRGSSTSLSEAAGSVGELVHASRVLELPITRAYGSDASAPSLLEPPPRLSFQEMELVELLQAPLPVSGEPWQVIAQQLSCSEELVLAHLASLQRSGVLRSISARRPTPPSAAPSALGLWTADDPDRAARTIAGLPGITLAAVRPARPDWPYNLYGSARGITLQVARERLAAAARRAGLGAPQVLPTVRRVHHQRPAPTDRAHRSWHWAHPPRADQPDR